MCRVGRCKGVCRVGGYEGVCVEWASVRVRV